MHRGVRLPKADADPATLAGRILDQVLHHKCVRDLKQTEDDEEQHRSDERHFHGAGTSAPGGPSIVPNRAASHDMLRDVSLRHFLSTEL